MIWKDTAPCGTFALHSLTPCRSPPNRDTKAHASCRASRVPLCRKQCAWYGAYAKAMQVGPTDSDEIWSVGVWVCAH
jgi:hypothetical protein